MSPKYLATLSLAVARSMSPASASTALLGPYQLRNQFLTSSSLAASRSFIEPIVGVDRVEDHRERAAVGLVLALALLVLDHAALLVEQALIDGAEQVAHAIGFHEQRDVERRGRHVLEVVGAIGIG